jgi:Arc/MetJ-type ribon-helix-helix transcriptional regulator
VTHRIRMAIITATLPIQMLDQIDDLVENGKVPSRSFVIREAVDGFLKELEHTAPAVRVARPAE